MTKTEKTATILMTILVIASFTFGCYRAMTPSDTETTKILRECGINPVNGAWLEGK